MFFKALFAGAIIVFASWLAGKKPVLAGFVISLPLMSMISIVYVYLQDRDMEKINQFALSILVGVPLSLTFFIPFLLNRWFKLSFTLTYALAVGCLILAYTTHQWFFRSIK